MTRKADKNGAAETAAPREVKDPVTGEPMVIAELTDEAAIYEAQLDSGKASAPARNFTEKVLRKQAEHGVLYRTPSTGYLMRVKDEAGA